MIPTIKDEHHSSVDHQVSKAADVDIIIDSLRRHEREGAIKGRGREALVSARTRPECMRSL